MNPPPKSKRPHIALRLLPWLLVAGLFVFFIANAWIGIDFGKHWDEVLTLGSVTNTIETGILLPHYYYYGGVNYWLALLPVIPGAMQEIRRDEPWTPSFEHEFHGTDSVQAYMSERSGFDVIQERLTAHAESDTYRFRVRRLWALIVGLGILWCFWAASAGTSSRWFGLVAAAAFGLSWEMLYHSRWIAPDALAAAFAALTMAFVAMIYHDRFSRVWPLLAAVAAGVTCGTKYNGGIVLLPVLLATWFSMEGRERLVKLLALGRGFVVFAVSFLITSPGTILNPLRFYDARQYNQTAYGLGHGGQTVDPGWGHVSTVLEYLAQATFSWYPLLALTLFLLAILGIYAIFRRDWREGVVWLAAPILYLLIMSSMRNYFPRNYLLLVPFLAVLIAYGFRQIWDWLRPVAPLRALPVLLIVAAAAVNGKWIAQTTPTIPDRVALRSELADQAADYIGQRPEQSFCLSPRVSEQMPPRTPSNVTAHVDGSDQVVFYALEIPRRDYRLPGTTHDLAVTWFGPWEVNFNYYPSWIGEDRIVVMRTERFKRLGLHRTGWTDPASARAEWERLHGK